MAADQFTLFAEPAAGTDITLLLRARAFLGDRWDNFRWWCDGGNHEMCAAVLWRNGILSPADASRAVRQIAEGATC